jgi:Zn-dependent protease
MSSLVEYIILLPPLLLAVILHEVAHGLAAEKLGDPTARRLGRISLNPIKHIDPFMTIILPTILKLIGAPIFAGAKPVPVNPLYFKKPLRGMAYVALAGPAINAAIAFICFCLLQIIRMVRDQNPYSYLLIGNILELWMIFGVSINIMLGGFNLLPIPPLDGGRILVGFLPKPLARIYSQIEPHGMLIVFALLYSGMLNKILLPLIKLSSYLTLNEF